MKIISVKISLKIHFCHGNLPLCSGKIAVPSGPKFHTVTIILAVFAHHSRWRHKPWKGLLVTITSCKHFKHFFTEGLNISPFHYTQWKLRCLETLMQLNITSNDITATTFQSTLPRYAYHAHFVISQLFTKVDNIINSLHEEKKSDNIDQQSNDLHLWPVTFDVYSVPAKFHVSP